MVYQISTRRKIQFPAKHVTEHVRFPDERFPGRKVRRPAIRR